MKRGVVVLVVLAGLLAVMGTNVTAQESDAWIPGIASFLIPGLGQLLNDEFNKAIIHFGVDVAILAAGTYVVSLLPWSPYRYGIVGLAHLAWSLYSGYDAYTVAKKTGFTIGFTEDGLTLAYHF